MWVAGEAELASKAWFEYRGAGGKRTDGYTCWSNLQHSLLASPLNLLVGSQQGKGKLQSCYCMTPQEVGCQVPRSRSPDSRASRMADHNHHSFKTILSSDNEQVVNRRLPVLHIGMQIKNN